ncbi:MAG: hypothetical protein HRU20_25275 [Pseudomonadales bacterium]|nr:hypothetical protein [Pseudomonadales bacterium]
MELNSTLYIQHCESTIAAALQTLFALDEITPATMQKYLQPWVEEDTIEKLFAMADVNAFFVEESELQQGFIIASLISPNGAEQSLLPLAKFFNTDFIDINLRIKAQGEECYFVFIRQEGGKIEMRDWEEDDPELLMEYMDWFNDGLPDSLQENSVDF